LRNVVTIVACLVVLSMMLSSCNDKKEISLIKGSPKISSCLNSQNGFSLSYRNDVTVKQPFIVMRKGDKEWELIYYSEKKRLDENAINDLNTVVVVKDTQGTSYQYGGGIQGSATLYIHDAEITYFDITSNQYSTDRISNEQRDVLPWGIHESRHEYVKDNTIIEQVKRRNKIYLEAIKNLEAIKKDSEQQDKDEGVIINGVKWATRNVNFPHTFALSPESSGMFYQWNRKIGWSANEPTINSDGKTDWDNTVNGGVKWTADNDPSPAGWRIPTSIEMESLLDTTKVSSEWTTINNVAGRKFTDITTGKSIFMPIVGYRNYDGTFHDAGMRNVCAKYWSSSTRHENGIYYAISLYLCDDKVGFGSDWDRCGCGYSVRSVANSE